MNSTSGFYSQLQSIYSTFFSEPFLESIPQIHILMCLIVSNNSFISGYVAFTIISSVLSGGFGIAKFFKTGPCKILPRSSGFLDGFVSLGFPAVLLSVIATLLGKGLMLPVVVEGADGIIFVNVVMWMGFNLFPQFLYVSKFQLKLLQPRLYFSFDSFDILCILICVNYFSNISFAGIFCLMGNPWFQEGMQSLLQLSSAGTNPVLWKLDIWSCSAKE